MTSSSSAMTTNSAPLATQPTITVQPTETMALNPIENLTSNTLTSTDETRSNSTTSSSQPHQQSPFRSFAINRHRELPIIEPLLNLSDLNLITHGHHHHHHLHHGYGHQGMSYVHRFKEITGSDRTSTGGSSTGDLLWEHEITGSTDELVSLASCPW